MSARFVVCDSVTKDEDGYVDVVFIVWDRMERVIVGDPQATEGEAEDLCGSLNLITKPRRKRRT